MSKVTPVFKAADGSEHPSAAAAARRNKVIKATAAVKDAMDELKRAIKGEILTADGVPFCPPQSSVFWYLVPGYFSLPRLHRVYVYPNNVDVDRDDDGTFVIHEFSYDRKEYVHYKLSELYASQDAARKAFHTRIDERLKELAKEADDLKKQRD